MTTWQQRAAEIIEALDLPDELDLKARRRAVLDARPYFFRVTSTGRKTWAKAQRAYLARFGAVPRGGFPVLPLLPESPLERQRRRSLDQLKRLTLFPLQGQSEP